MFSVPMSHADARAIADGLNITSGAPAWLAAPIDVAAEVATLLDQLEFEEVETPEAETWNS